MARNGSSYQLLGGLRAEEYAALEADIAKRGVLVPVERDERGNVLDGHNRVEIADRLGKPYKTIVRRFKTEEDKREHVIKLNMARRHLDPLRWGMAFGQLLNVEGVERRERARNDVTGATIASVAAELGVAKRTAQHRLAIADAYEKLPADARNGEEGKE
jgi:ParB-like chromosome segregation protein Spo0J